MYKFTEPNSNSSKNMLDDNKDEEIKFYYRYVFPVEMFCLIDTDAFLCFGLELLVSKRGKYQPSVKTS